MVTDESKYRVVLGQRVNVSTEIDKAFSKSIVQMRDCMRKEKRCAAPDFRYCSGDCSGCPWSTNGLTVCLDLIHEESTFFMSTHSTEDEAINRETIRTIYNFAGERMKQGDLILQLHFEEGLTSSEIAIRTGLCESTVNYRLTVVLRAIRKCRDLFM